VRPARATGVIARFLLPAACLFALACSTPPPDNSPDPCSLLSAECASCTQAGPKQECNNAVASGDAVQCTVALDNPSVQAACASDGGADAAADAATDAAPLPPCGETPATADAGCSCTGACTTSCPGGGCAFACEPAGTPCSPTCAGGDCTFECAGGASCEASCAGGHCTFHCAAGSTCANACAGGHCTFQCDEGAVCSDTCGGASTCIGP